jgi:ATP-dependent helicase/DNAse subunit B
VKILGKNILIKDHLETYLLQLLKNDMAFAPFRVVALEGQYEAPFEVEVAGEKKHIVLGGTIDRIDETGEGTRIIDYKTGRNMMLKFADVGQFYQRDKHNRPKEIFQTLVYSEIFRRSTGKANLLPAIYKIDEFFNDEFRPEIMHNGNRLNYQDVAGGFQQSLNEFLSEIFSVDNLYDQTEDKRKCLTCPYNAICRRG